MRIHVCDGCRNKHNCRPGQASVASVDHRCAIAHRGTHTPRPMLLEKEGNDQFAKPMSAAAYGSRPSPGRRVEGFEPQITDDAKAPLPPATPAFHIAVKTLYGA